MAFKILIQGVEKPPEKDLGKDIEWICQSLGFLQTKDKDKTCACIVKELIKMSAREKRALSSTELSQELKMSRGAVINHLNRLMKAGLIVRTGTRYCIRSQSTYYMIKEMEREVQRVFEDLEEMASEIDNMMGLRRREDNLRL